MNPVTLRRVAIIGVVLAVLLAADGLFMAVTNYKPDDASSNLLHLSDGGTILLAAALVLILAIIAFVMSRQAVTTDTPVSKQASMTEIADAPVSEQASTTAIVDAPVSEQASTPEPEVKH